MILTAHKNKIIRTIRAKNWSEAAQLVEKILGGGHLRDMHIGDSVSIKYVREELNDEWQYHYKITIEYLDSKCRMCGFTPTECVCDNPVL